MNTQKGFTLIELMIVVAIIGILAAIAIPAYQDYTARAQMSEAVTLTDGLKTKVSEIFSQNGTCPDNSTAAKATAAGIDLDTTVKGKYVLKVTTGGTAAASGGCTITATMNSTGVQTGIQSTTLTMTLSNADAGSNVWTCTSSAAQKYLPTSCTKA